MGQAQLGEPPLLYTGSLTVDSLVNHLGVADRSPDDLQGHFPWQRLGLLLRVADRREDGPDPGLPGLDVAAVPLFDEEHISVKRLDLHD